MKKNITNLKNSIALKQLTTVFSVLMLIIVLNGCHKKTKSYFKLNKTEYSAGDKLDFTNMNPLKNQIWEVTTQNGTVILKIQEKQPQIPLSFLISDGPYNLNLYDNQKDYNYEIKSSKSFVIKTKTGHLDVISNDSEYYDFQVFCDDENIGSSNNYGGFHIELPIGMRYIKVKSGNKESITLIELNTTSEETITFE